MVVVLVLLSRLKHDVVQMTVNFIDLMMIDRDTVAFLFTIFPNLRWSVILAGLVTLPLMYALWWLDPFRIRRLPALASMLACVAALVGYSLYHPDEAWRGYYDDGYLSKFFRSGVTAVSDFVQSGFMESAASTKKPVWDLEPTDRYFTSGPIHGYSSRGFVDLESRTSCDGCSCLTMAVELAEDFFEREFGGTSSTLAITIC